VSRGEFFLGRAFDRCTVINGDDSWAGEDGGGVGGRLGGVQGALSSSTETSGRMKVEVEASLVSVTRSRPMTVLPSGAQV